MNVGLRSVLPMSHFVTVSFENGSFLSFRGSRLLQFPVLAPHLVHTCNGGGERDRTDDLLRARQALSQLSYTPNKHLQMVGLDGVEPSTSRLSGVRSNRTELQALASAW
jgi:hypothetical protein